MSKLIVFLNLSGICIVICSIKTKYSINAKKNNDYEENSIFTCVGYCSRTVFIRN